MTRSRSEWDARVASSKKDSRDQDRFLDNAFLEEASCRYRLSLLTFQTINRENETQRGAFLPRPNRVSTYRANGYLVNINIDKR